MEEEDDRTKLLENALGAVRRLHASVPDTKLAKELNTLRGKFQSYVHALQSVADHRDELLAKNEKLEVTNQALKVTNQALGKEVKTLDAMRDLLEPVHRG